MIVTDEMTDFRKVGRGAQELDGREERLVNGLQVSSGSSGSKDSRRGEEESKFEGVKRAKRIGISEIF
jgi:hypothetical protein